MEFLKYPQRFFAHMLIAPFLWGMTIPLILLDIGAELYHRVSFPLYGMPYVSRSSYIKFARYKLPYLNILEKMFCFYCEYANGLLHYASAIAGNTEKYWCGIKQEKSKQFRPPQHHKEFVLEYGDKEAFTEFKRKSQS